MAKYQLIVKGEDAEYTAGDCMVVDMKATTIEEAREEAKRHLYGDPAKWSGEFGRSYGGEDFCLHLDPDEDLYKDYDHSALIDREEALHSATIVEVHDTVDLQELRDKIRDFRVEEKRRKEQERDEAELKRLQQKLGANP